MCSWDERTTALAEANGHMDVLQWAWENGCEYEPRSRDLDTYTRAKLGAPPRGALMLLMCDVC